MKMTIQLAAGAALALLSLSSFATAQEVDSAEAAAEKAAASSIQYFCTANGARDFSMNARFRQRTGSTDFKAEFEAARNVGFTLGQSLDVLVGGKLVGKIVLKRDVPGTDLVGGLEFSSRPEDRKPFPAGFPAVKSGVSVTVGPLGCALR